MWNQKEVRREPLPDGTVLCTENGRFTIQKYITSGGFALLYQAQEEGQMYPVILKEYFPRQGYVRVDGAVLPEEAAALPENDPEREKRIETMRTLFEERADREIRVGQQSRQRTRLTVPVDRKLPVRSIQLPGKKKMHAAVQLHSGNGVPYRAAGLLAEGSVGGSRPALQTRSPFRQQAAGLQKFCAAVRKDGGSVLRPAGEPETRPQR